ncbi:type VI secretion system protein [Chitinimonas sp. JJ19]|uniref:type VI secretion system protein n=1 Tax=Chitinimonas sp. JJ19 TaxID=3109352 RepID=UPI0030032C36
MAKSLNLGSIPYQPHAETWSLPVLLGLGCGAIILVLLVWLLLRSRRPAVAKPAAAAPAAAASTPAKPAPAASLSPQHWADVMLGALRYLSTRREWRYRSPWVLLLGEQGAGKSSLVASLQDGQREAVLLREQKLPVTDTQWHFCSGGAVVDPNGLLPAAEPDSSEGKRWLKVLDAIDSRRPERPVDGVVLTLSAATLLRADTTTLQDLAESCYRQLWQLQKRFEFVLPVYVVLTQCDAIAGYRAFWSAQPVARRKEIWGWSNPSLTDYEDIPGLLKQLFTEQINNLRQVQIEAAAGRDQIADADDFFLFPQRFGRLSVPLGALLETVLKPSTYHAGFYFRGVYFSGSLAADGATPSGVNTQIDFVENLFTQKILAESGLARPVRQSIWSRNNLIRRVQFGGLAIVCGLFAALAWSSVQLRQQTTSLGNAFDMVHTVSEQSVRKGRCLGQSEVYGVLKAVGSLKADLGFAAIPASWVDTRMVDDASKWLSQKAFQDVVMPSIACKLEQRAQDLTGFQGKRRVDNLITSSSVAAANADLDGYVASVIELERNLDAFRELALPGGDEAKLRQVQLFEQLSHYAYGTPPPMQRNGLNSLYYDSLARLHYKTPLALPSQMKEGIARQIDLQSDGLRKELLERIDLGERLVQMLGTDNNTAGQAAVMEHLVALQDWLGWMRSNWLGNPRGGNPCVNTGNRLAERLQPLYQRHGYPMHLADADAHFSPTHCTEPALAKMKALTLPPYGAVFVPAGEDYTLNPALAPELTGFVALRKLSFMPHEGRQNLSCQFAQAGWRQEQLGQAANYLREYQSFATAQSVNEDGDRPLFDRLARRQLQLVLNATLSDAQKKPLDWHAAGQADQESQMASQSASFGKQLDALNKLLTQLQQVNGAGGAEPFSRCLREYAGDMLLRVDALAENSKLYQPESAVGEMAGGTHPVYLFGDSGQVKEYLVQQRERSAVLADYAAPFVSLLDRGGSLGTANGASQGYWRNTITELKRYRDFKEPGSSLGALETLFSKTLATLDYETCSTSLAQAGKAAEGYDLYSQRYRMLSAQSLWRCQDRREADAYMRYRKLANRFNRELIGRYPFADSDARDADLNTVRAFFRDYDAERDGLDKAIAGLKHSRWNDIRRFLDRLDTVADFLRPTLGTTEGSKPVRLGVGFRALSRQTLGAEQLISWHLSTGSALAEYPGSTRDLDWPFGEAIVLDLNWAKQSAWRPVVDTTQSTLRVDGSVASFAAAGNWGLLRFIEAHQPVALPSTDPLDPSRWLLQFNVPLADSANPAARSHARVFLALTLNSIDPKTQAAQPLLLPRDWPRAAPFYW